MDPSEDSSRIDVTDERFVHIDDAEEMESLRRRGFVLSHSERTERVSSSHDRLTLSDDFDVAFRSIRQCRLDDGGRYDDCIEIDNGR